MCVYHSSNLYIEDLSFKILLGVTRVAGEYKEYIFGPVGLLASYMLSESRPPLNPWLGAGCVLHLPVSSMDRHYQIRHLYGLCISEGSPSSVKTTAVFLVATINLPSAHRYSLVFCFLNVCWSCETAWLRHLSESDVAFYSIVTTRLSQTESVVFELGMFSVFLGKPFL